MAKCPFCGDKLKVSQNIPFGFYYCCGNGCCCSRDKFATSDEALSAASKRFMPMVDESGNVTGVRCV